VKLADFRVSKKEANPINGNFGINKNEFIPKIQNNLECAIPETVKTKKGGTPNFP
jgi:hypothetical protein